MADGGPVLRGGLFSSLHQASAVHGVPFLHISDVLAISMATAGPHLPQQAASPLPPSPTGRGRAGGPGLPAGNPPAD